MSAMTHADAQTLLASIQTLTASIECLCSHVNQNAAITAAHIEATTLLRLREEQIFGQLDRLELFMAQQSTYPTTQQQIPGAEQARLRIMRDAKELGG